MSRTVKYTFLSMVLTIFTTQTAFAQEKAPERSLEGAWIVKITPRTACEGGDPVPAFAFESLITFHQGGTTSMSIKGNTNIATLVRTPFHGLWRKEHGWNTYKFKVMHIRSLAATMEFRGLQETGGTVTLSESGDEFTTDGYTLGYSVDGVPGPPNCSNSAGVRLKLD